LRPDKIDLITTKINRAMLNHRLLVGAVATAWIAALYGLLSLHRLTADWGHDICGPWGCGPPLQALIGWHGFWFVAASLPVALAVRTWPKKRQWWIGLGLVATGLIGVLAIVGVQCFAAYQAVSQGQPAYLIQRCLFNLATFVNVPLVPMILAGAVLMISGRTKKPEVEPQID
jgi:hypothetical protein